MVQFVDSTFESPDRHGKLKKLQKPEKYYNFDFTKFQKARKRQKLLMSLPNQFKYLYLNLKD